MAEEYLNFNETVERLGISEDELLNLVSCNTLRAFRIDRETKFKLEDVEAVAGGVNSAGLVELNEEDGDDVLDLDELPDDIVMVDEGDSSVEEIEPEESSDLMSFEDEDGLQSAPLVEMGDSSSVMELDQSSELVDFGDDSLEILDSMDSEDADSNPEFEETVITDSSSITNTEELSVDDDDFDFSTQEVTVQEDAISEDEIASEKTVIDKPAKSQAAVQEEEYEGDDYDDEDEVVEMRGSGRRTSFNRRKIMEKEPKFKTDLLWTGLLAALVIVMLYPTMMMASLLFYGFTTSGNSSIDVGKQTFDGGIRNISAVFVPDMFKWVQGTGVNNFLGSRTFGKGYTGHIPFQKRIDMGMLKLDTPEKESGTSAENQPAPANE